MKKIMMLIVLLSTSAFGVSTTVSKSDGDWYLTTGNGFDSLDVGNYGIVLYYSDSSKTYMGFDVKCSGAQEYRPSLWGMQGGAVLKFAYQGSYASTSDLPDSLSCWIGPSKNSSSSQAPTQNKRRIPDRW